MIILWGRNNLTNVKKVLRTLEELELPHNQILASGQHGGNRNVDYLALNPDGLVPLLCDDEMDVVLWELNTIVRYLAVQYGQKRLWIDALAAHVVGEKRMDWANQTLSHAYRVILLGLVRTSADQRDMAAIEVNKQVYGNLFTILDNALADQSWLSGVELGITGTAVAPLIYNLFNVGLSWTPRSYLERWYQQLTERPAFQKTVMIPVS